MHNETKTTPWNIVENQVARLRLVEGRIEAVRKLLAEDLRIRLSRPENNVDASVDYRRSSKSACGEGANNPAFSAC